MKIRVFMFLVVLALVPGEGAIAADKIGALGRIEPKGGIIDLVGPAGDIIAEIMVKEGEPVAKGVDLVAFTSRKTCELEAELADLSVKEADELGAKSIGVQRLRVREADELGAKAVSIQQQKITAAKADHEFAMRRLTRFKKAEGQSISEQMMDERENLVQVTGAKLDSARQELSRLILNREINMALASRELERLVLNREITVSRTQKQAELAGEKLERTTLKAPVDGTILEVLQNPGESVTGRPIIRMADLANMLVVAEVFEGDLLKLKPGMAATITSSAFPGPLTGKVASVGKIVDPSSRTARVRIRLSASDVASRLIDMEVDVSIEF